MIKHCHDGLGQFWTIPVHRWCWFIDVTDGIYVVVDGHKVSIYHTQVVRSASMPHSKNSSNFVEKSASVEFRLVSQHGKPAVIMPSTTPTLTRALQPTLPCGQSQGKTLFYHPMVHTSPSFQHRTAAALPDIGAPDITNELIRDEAKCRVSSMNRDSNSSPSPPNHKLSTSSLDNTAQRSSGKGVFYTHSMKKKSTEPKFV